MSADSAARKLDVSDSANLAPDTGKPISRGTLLRFGIGMTVFNFMWMTAGTAASTVLLPERFNQLGIGQPEAILAAMNSVGCLFALVSNIVFGAVSDRCRSRFGKRTPFIAVGGLIAAVASYLTSIAGSMPAIVASWSLLQVGLNCMYAPMAAVLSDRVPESARGRVSAFYGAGTVAGGSFGIIMGSAFINNMTPAFVMASVIWALSGVVAVTIMPREKSAEGNGAGGEAPSARELLATFKPPIKGARDFYLALFGRLMLIFGYYMVYGYQLYVCERYIGLDATAAGVLVSTMSVINLVISFASSIVSGFVSDKSGTRKIPVILSSVFIAVGIAVPWLLGTEGSMLAYAAIMALGYGIYTSVDQALNVDVLPNPDDAGKDLGILNLAMTLGQVLAPIATSSIVMATDSYFLVFPVAMGVVLFGCVFIMMIRKVK